VTTKCPPGVDRYWREIEFGRVESLLPIGDDTKLVFLLTTDSGFLSSLVPNVKFTLRCQLLRFINPHKMTELFAGLEPGMTLFLVACRQQRRASLSYHRCSSSLWDLPHAFFSASTTVKTPLLITRSYSTLSYVRVYVLLFSAKICYPTRSYAFS